MFTDACGKMTTSFGDIASITASTSEFVNLTLTINSVNHSRSLFLHCSHALLHLSTPPPPPTPLPPPSNHPSVPTLPLIGIVDVMKSKWRRAENLRGKRGDNKTLKRYLNFLN